jgi:hypothetical protein
MPRRTPASYKTPAQRRLEERLALKALERQERRREALAALDRAQKLGIATPVEYANAGILFSRFPRRLG